jgi:LacI family transcriptional regulator
VRRDATAKKIAEQTGLSLPTVWQVLGNKGHRYSESTRERVLTAAREMGYRPNASAKAISTGRFGAAALMLSTDSGNSYLPESLLGGIHDSLAAHNLHMTLAKAPDEELASTGFVPKILREWMVDGLLINNYGAIPAPFLTALREHNLPSVWINTKYDADCVHPDDVTVGRIATEYLIGLGHRRIAYVAHTTNHYSDADREAGYRAVMEAAGLTPQKLLCDLRNYRIMPMQPLPEWLASPECWLRWPDRPTALIVYAEYIAVPLLHAAALLGLRIPEDLSLIAIAPSEVYDTAFPLTTVLLPEREIGETAVEMLLAKIEEPATPLLRRSLVPGFQEGISCAPPPRP